MIIVGCGKTKRPYRSYARDLYTGSLFRAARQYVEERGEQWFIASAEHGLTHPLDVLEPYENKLALRGLALEVWARRVAEAIERQLDVPYPTVTLLAGATYAAPLRSALEGLKISVAEPLAGLMVGERLAWFKRVREARDRALIDEHASALNSEMSEFIGLQAEMGTQEGRDE